MKNQKVKQFGDKLVYRHGTLYIAYQCQSLATFVKSTTNEPHHLIFLFFASLFNLVIARELK
jgi:hypothetical protein